MLSTTQKDDLELLAAAMMSNEQICIALQIDPAIFQLSMEDSTSEIFQIVMSARITIEAAINKSIIDCAKQGSSPAQIMAARLLKNLKS